LGQAELPVGTGELQVSGRQPLQRTARFRPQSGGDGNGGARWPNSQSARDDSDTSTKGERTCRHRDRPPLGQEMSQSANASRGFSRDSGDTLWLRSSSSAASSTSGRTYTAQAGMAWRRTSSKRLASQRGREVLMNEKPVCSALLPNTGVANLRFRHLAVFRFLGVAHGDGGPR
jgi:hypothetical protein